MSNTVKRLKGVQLYTMLATCAGLPSVLFLYMFFSFFFSQPHIFSKEFSYTIFPNLEKEYEYLAGIGRQDFAENFVNYQINIVMFSACAVALIFVIYILIMFSKYRQLDIQLFPSKLIWRPLVGVFVTGCYMWGIVLLDRTDDPTSKLNVSGKTDYYYVWIMFSVCLCLFSYLVMYLIDFIFLTSKNLFETTKKLFKKGSRL